MEQLLLPGAVPSGLAGPVDLDALVNNSFVAQYNDFDHQAVVAATSDYAAAE